RDQVLDRDGRHRGVLRVRPWVRVVAVEKVLVAEVLQPVHAEAAAAAGEDRAEKDAVALLDPRREHGARADFLEDAYWFVTEDPRSRGAGIAVEERARVSAADAARFNAKERSLRIDPRLGHLADLDHVDAGHEGGLHRAATVPTACFSSPMALLAVHRSRITLDSARVIASGERCMKMLRPTEHPIAPADMADSIRLNSSSSSRRDPPASTTGMPLADSTRYRKDASSPGQLVLMMSAPSSPHSRTLRRRYSNPYRCLSSSTEA